MTSASGTLVCPKGHTSSEPDYCSECGAKIGGVSASLAQGGRGLTSSTPQVCPDCATAREQTGIAFCEVCGYNFSTGAHGELNIVAFAEGLSPTASAEPEQGEARSPKSIAAELPTGWAVVISVDPSLRRPESPEPPPDFAPCSVALDRPVSLIGRPNEARAIFPEIALPFDEAVSRRHALLQTSDAGALSLRDIGSANGTRLNGKDVDAMTDTPLKAGDEITLGHWTRLTVQGSA